MGFCSAVSKAFTPGWNLVRRARRHAFSLPLSLSFSLWWLGYKDHNRERKRDESPRAVRGNRFGAAPELHRRESARRALAMVGGEFRGLCFSARVAAVLERQRSSGLLSGRRWNGTRAPGGGLMVIGGFGASAIGGMI